jgi:hypothetical protein
MVIMRTIGTIMRRTGANHAFLVNLFMTTFGTKLTFGEERTIGTITGRVIMRRTSTNYALLLNLFMRTIGTNRILLVRENIGIDTTRVYHENDWCQLNLCWRERERERELLLSS